MRIGELAQRAGVSAQTVRYYERIGILPGPDRTASGYRRYAEEDADRLAFITRAKLLGLTLEEIGDILSASGPDSVNCEHVLALLETKRAQIAAWIEEAEGLRYALTATIAASRSRMHAEASGRARQGARGQCHCTVIERGLHERALRLQPPIGAEATPA